MSLSTVSPRDVREHAQLDLRVVDRDQRVAGLGDEAGADLAPDLRADRDVLQVRVDRREAPGRGVRLQQRRVHPAVRPDRRRQLLEVGLHELGQLAPALDLRHDRVLVADRLQHARVGREAGLAAPLARQPELAEQHLGELLRRADHELLAGELPDLALELGGVGAHPQPRLLEPRGVELHAGLLGLPQHVHERQLDVVQQVLQPALAHLLALTLGELVDQDCVDRLRVVGLDRHPALLAQLRQRVAAARGVEQVGGDLRVEHEVRRDLAERLGVVRDHRPLAGGRDELGGIGRPRPPARTDRPRRRRSATRSRAAAARPRAPPARSRRAPARRRTAWRRRRRRPCGPRRCGRSRPPGAGSRPTRRRRAPPPAAAAGRAARTRGTSRAASSGPARASARRPGRARSGRRGPSSPAAWRRGHRRRGR